MSSVRTAIAILASDIHLSLTPPIARSCEKDWLGVQRGYLKQLEKTALQNKCPIVIAGDIFHKADSSAELINFAIEYMPRTTIYTVPGQHDLVNHNMENIRKSAYWTLVEAKTIIDLGDASKEHKEHASDRTYTVLRLWGFPWKAKLSAERRNNFTYGDPNKGKSAAYIDLAVVHSYIWKDDACYPNAPESNYITHQQKLLSGFNAAVFGDNHKGFLVRSNSISVPHILNCGTFIRRNADEKDYDPCIGVLYNDGTIVRQSLDTSEDKFIDVPESIPTTLDQFEGEQLLQELKKIVDQRADFRELIKRRLESLQTSVEVCKVIMRCLGVE